MEPNAPPTPPAAIPAPAPARADALGVGGLLLGLLLVLLIAAILWLAITLNGWYWLGPGLLLVASGLWFFNTRRHFRGLVQAALDRHLAAAADLARSHCHAGAIAHYEHAAQLAVRLGDQPCFARIEQNRAESRQAETAAIERLAFVLYGLHAGRDKALERIRHESVVNLTGFSVHDEALEAVPSLPHLRRLHLRGKFITDKTLRYAAHARGLIELYLENTAVTDDGLRQFRADAWTPDHPDREIALLLRRAAQREAAELAGDLPGETDSVPPAEGDARDTHAAHAAHAEEAHRVEEFTAPPPASASPAGDGANPADPLPEINDLKFLHLEGAPVTDAGLAHLAGFTALERLSLHKTQITGAGLRHLAPLQRLKLLSLDGAAIGDDAVPHLARLPHLERLELYATHLTGTTLAHLATLPHLKRLDLSRAPLVDEAVEGLIQLKHLKHLVLHETPLSPGAVNHLRAHLIGVQIAV